MSCDVQGRPVSTLEVDQVNMAGLGAGHGQHGVITAGAETAEPAGVVGGVEYVELGGGAGEGEHLDHVLQHHHYPVSA